MRQLSLSGQEMMVVRNRASEREVVGENGQIMDFILKAELIGFPQKLES